MSTAIRFNSNTLEKVLRFRLPMILRLSMMASLLISVTAASLLSGCGESKEVSFNSGGVKQTFAAGKDATPDSSFPLPIYPAAKTTGTVAAQGDADDNSKFLMLSSHDTVSQIGDFYEAQMKKDGWNIVTLNTLPSMVNISAEKDMMESSVMVTNDGEVSCIKLQVGNKVEGIPAPSTAPVVIDKMNPPTD